LRIFAMRLTIERVYAVSPVVSLTLLEAVATTREISL